MSVIVKRWPTTSLKLEVSKRAGMKPPGANEPLVISFTDSKVQAALDELAASAGDDAASCAHNTCRQPATLTGLLQGRPRAANREGRSEAADARGKYYPELFRLLRGKTASAGYCLRHARRLSRRGHPQYPDGRHQVRRSPR